LLLGANSDVSDQFHAKIPFPQQKNSITFLDLTLGKLPGTI
jgi:hypothetical protein